MKKIALENIKPLYNLICLNATNVTRAKVKDQNAWRARIGDENAATGRIARRWRSVSSERSDWLRFRLGRVSVAPGAVGIWKLDDAVEPNDSGLFEKTGDFSLL